MTEDVDLIVCSDAEEILGIGDWGVETLLNDPLYLGNRHARVRGADYDAFIAKYLQTAATLFPSALLHFEDFGPGNARRILLAYAGKYRIFNDDMQGTGAITLAAAMSAVKVTGVPMAEQRLLVFGAPWVLLNKSNIGTPSDSYDAPTDYPSLFEKLWHVG